MAKRSAAQRNQFAHVKKRQARNENKENIAHVPPEVQSTSRKSVQKSPEEAVLAMSKRLANTQRQNRRLKYVGKSSAGPLPAPVISIVDDWEALEDDEMEE